MPVLIATSLKMYLDHEETVSWASAVRETALASPLVEEGRVELALFPTFPSIPAIGEVFEGTRVRLGAQNVAREPSGAFTGEVGAPTLAQVGCTYVEIAHAERRRYFHETVVDFRGKVRASVEHGLTPLICAGETTRAEPADAVAECTGFLEEVLADISPKQPTDVVIAYEPVWAIGAAQAAEPAYIREVTTALQQWAAQHPKIARGRVIYGGSAGPGLYTELAGAVDGLFLGRFAHDPAAIEAILGEVEALS